MVWINSLPDKGSFVTRHLIPDNEAIWTEDKFEEFIADRAQLILNKIDRYVTGKKLIGGQTVAAAIT